MEGKVATARRQRHPGGRTSSLPTFRRGVQLSAMEKTSWRRLLAAAGLRTTEKDRRLEAAATGLPDRRRGSRLAEQQFEIAPPFAGA
jgi:hypothetical protein